MKSSSLSSSNELLRLDSFSLFSTTAPPRIEKGLWVTRVKWGVLIFSECVAKHLHFNEWSPLASRFNSILSAIFKHADLRAYSREINAFTTLRHFAKKILAQVPPLPAAARQKPRCAEVTHSSSLRAAAAIASFHAVLGAGFSHRGSRPMLRKLNTFNASDTDM
jgi:hypothetical protein